MRERPSLPDHALLAVLADGWGVAAAAVEFLPVGDDLLVYPWADGVAAMGRGLSDRPWTALGRVADDRLGEATGRHALAEFRRLFAPGDVVEVARRVDRDLTVS